MPTARARGPSLLRPSPMEELMGSIYRRGGKIYISYRLPGGQWRYQTTGFDAGQEARAKKLLASIEDKIKAGVELAEIMGTPIDAGPVTVQQYALGPWLDRRKQHVADWKNDRTRLTKHI